jgi:hypothetical protein
MQSIYQLSRVVVYESVDGGRKQKLGCLRGMNVLDQDFKRYLDQNEGLRQEYNKVMSGQHCAMDTYAVMLFEFAFINRARFAMEQKIELAKCSSSLASKIIKSDALAKVNAELDYVSGLLDSLGSTGVSILRTSVKQVRQYGLDDLAYIDDEEEQDDGEDLPDNSHRAAFIDDSESSTYLEY